MVYHHPAEDRLVNSVYLGPLRLLLSDSAAARFFRLVPDAVTKATITTVGVAGIIKTIPWPQSVIDIYNEKINMPIEKTVLAGIGITLAAKFASMLLKKWAYSVAPRDIDPVYDFFRVRDDLPKTEADFEEDFRKYGRQPGAAFVKSVGRWVINPSLSVDDGMKRAFNTVGMTLAGFLSIESTVGLEYPFTAWCRIFRNSFNGLLGWFEPVSAVTRYKLYQSILNTSLACFARTRKGDIDPDLGVDVGGHFVLDNVRLVYADTALRTFRKIVIFMNHETFELEKVVMIHDREGLNGLTEITTWGSANHAENTDNKRLSPAESLHQAGLIIGVVVAYYTHGTVHWWSGAVAAMPKGSWSGAGESTLITQWMNTQAIMLSWFFSGSNMPTIANMLIFNAHNGLPLHGIPGGGEEGCKGEEICIDVKTFKPDGTPVNEKRPLAYALGDRSTFHQLSSAVQRALQKHFDAKRDPESHTMPEVQGMVAATAMHNVEHFMLGELTPMFSSHAQCVVLRTDLSGLFKCLVYPISYWLRPFLLCRLRFWDELSRLVYTTCDARAEELKKANAAAKKQGAVEPYAAPKSFAQKYLNVGCAV